MSYAKALARGEILVLAEKNAVPRWISMALFEVFWIAAWFRPRFIKTSLLIWRNNLIMFWIRVRLAYYTVRLELLYIEKFFRNLFGF